MTFLLLDDHDIVRTGVKNMLMGLYASCTVYAAANEKEFLQHLKTTTPDLVIIDVHIPELDTPGIMEYMRCNYPGLKVLVFSMGAENVYAKRFLNAGAMGFVSKNSDMAELEKAIRLVLDNVII